jgi:hypothetical protein
MSLARVSLRLALLGSVGCATVRPLRDPALFIARNHPRVVYITYRDDASLYVVEPRVSGDSLFGRVVGGLDTLAVAVPFHDLAVVQAKQRDWTGIVLFIGWIAASAAAAVYGDQAGAGTAP